MELAVSQAPQDVLRAISADAEVAGIPGGEFPGPDGISGAVPAVGDGVADEVEIDAAFLGLGDVGVVARHPLRIRHAGLVGAGAGLIDDAGADCTGRGGGAGGPAGQRKLSAVLRNRRQRRRIISRGEGRILSTDGQHVKPGHAGLQCAAGRVVHGHDDRIGRLLLIVRRAAHDFPRRAR